MECEKRIHKAHEEYERAKKEGYVIPKLVGKYQYIFSSKKGKISLIQMKPFIGKKMYWEIYCLEGNFFEDTERFDSRILAEKRIGEILE